MFTDEQIGSLMQKKHLAEMFHGELQEGFNALKGMKNASAVFNAAMAIMIYDIEMGMGIYDADEPEEEFPVYDMVENLWSEYSGGCYFCDPKKEPNEPFTKSSRLCMKCARKLGRFLDAIGVDKKKVMPGLPDEPPAKVKPSKPDDSFYNMLARMKLGEEFEVGHDDGEPFD